MKTLGKIGIGLCMATAFCYAESWTGKLVDASCAQNPQSGQKANEAEKRASCAPTVGTTSFAIQTADGHVLKLDASGNSKAATAVRADASKAKDANVTISGTMDGSTIKVESLNMSEAR